jgi:penicillin-binding protein 1C
MQIRNLFSKLKRKKKWVLAGVIILIFPFYWFSLPGQLFKDPYSTLLLDSEGRLIGARIADDGQWRFPQQENVESKFEQSLLQFEDRQFYRHPGFNPASFCRAMWQNIQAGKVVSGGSTISMQLLRLSRKQKQRNIWEKFAEVVMATRLEIAYSKKEILCMYAAHAPFGGNVVGVEAAAWRYFGRSSAELSWAEAATLAVLPNAPGLLHPGRNRQQLLEKRNRLLNRLESAGIINKEDLQLALTEPLPMKPYPLPALATHLLERCIKEGKEGSSIKSSIKASLQQRVMEITERQQVSLEANGVHNAAVLVLDVETGNALAYVGNTRNQPGKNGSELDMVNSPRSTGSILKPFLLAGMLNEGLLLPGTLVPDIPIQIAGYAPKNFNLTYDGAVPARRALERSLNVPSVGMLQQYGVEKFHHLLKKAGMKSLTWSPDHYGLSLILGGAEGTVWEIAGMYAGMARTLNHYRENRGRYSPDDFHAPKYSAEQKESAKSELNKHSVFDAAATWLTFEAMVEVARPDAEANWLQFASSGKIAWKTGTSFGYRDGWAIGITPDHVVAVWAGNADAEGRPGLTGINTAAPILFEIFSLLKTDEWFDAPFDEMEQIAVCRKSGMRATAICDPVDTTWIQARGLKTAPCSYHILIHLDPTEKFRVNGDCENVSTMVHSSWFVLPPAQEYYYRFKNPSYPGLPPYRSDCRQEENIHNMELIYPRHTGKIYVPLELDGKRGKTIFEVAHRKTNMQIYWHVDNQYAGSTKGLHQMGLSPAEGWHTLTLVDEKGESLSQRFCIIPK